MFEFRLKFVFKIVKCNYHCYLTIQANQQTKLTAWIKYLFLYIVFFKLTLTASKDIIMFFFVHYYYVLT